MSLQGGYPLRGAILPLGGGESFIFHKAFPLCDVIYSDRTIELLVKKLRVQEIGEDMMKEVDISEVAIVAAKAKYEKALSYVFFKELGDL